MSADNFALTTAGTRALGEHLLAASERRQPIFWIALALAATVHVVALVGIGRSVPREVGDPNGAADAIDVEIVDASALTKDMGMPSESGQISPQSPTVPPPQQPQPEPQPEAEPQPEPQPEAEPQPEPQPEQPQPEKAEPEQQPQEPDAPAAEAPKEEPPKAEPVPAEEASPELPAAAPEAEETAKKAEKAETKPEPEKKAEAKPKPKPPAEPKKRKSLDLSMPMNMADELPSSGSAGQDHSGFSRPPGITRSGENDRFGRDVIRALKRTMPRLTNVRGRCTIRILLNKRGNVASVKLVKGSGDRSLDGEVLFAAGQTSYPFPPKGATEVDRTFLVTYIYN